MNVTENNKAEYVRLVAEHKLSEAIRSQINAFRSGFYDLLKPSDVALFNEQEMELVISGLPDVDIEDLKANTEYNGYVPSSVQVCLLLCFVYILHSFIYLLACSRFTTVELFY